MERLAREMPKSQHLLETLEEVGRRRGLAEDRARLHPKSSIKRARSIGQMFYGRPFRLGKKGARRSGKPRGGGKKPQRLIGDKAYDSDEFREELKKEGIELVAPHRENRRKPKT